MSGLPQVSVPDKNSLKAQTDTLDGAAAALPQSLAPALQFQRIFLRIISGEPPSAWRDEIVKLANSKEQDPVQSGLAEISRAWLARLDMADIDTALRNYYRHNVRFPATLAEVESGVPDPLRKDPWGEPWIYKIASAHGFEGLERPALSARPDAISATRKPG